MGRKLNWPKVHGENKTSTQGSISTTRLGSLRDDEPTFPSELSELANLQKLNVPSRVMLKKFFRTSKVSEQISAMKYIFSTNDAEAEKIAKDIRDAFKINEFIPWPMPLYKPREKKN